MTKKFKIGDRVRTIDEYSKDVGTKENSLHKCLDQEIEIIKENIENISYGLFTLSKHAANYIAEIILLIKKDIENNKPYHNAVFDRVDEAFCNTSRDTKDKIIMLICDVLDNLKSTTKINNKKK